MEKSPDAFRTISEVSEWLDTPAHVLRFWESRFTQLRPVKRAGGRRYYRPADMALLSGKKKLLHDDGVTIRGVQKILREQGVRYVATLSPVSKDLGPLAEADLAGEQFAPVVQFERWKQDAASDSQTIGAAPGIAAPKIEPTPEAPMHVDAEEQDYPRAAGGSLHALAPRAVGTEVKGATVARTSPAAPPTVPRQEPGDEIEPGELRELGTADFDPEELTLTEHDLTISPDLEAEWAALLAEEAANRRSDLAPPFTDPAQPDLFASALAPLPVTFALPALLPESGGALPIPIATLLRQIDLIEEPGVVETFARLIRQLEALYHRLAEADDAPRT